MPSKSKTSPSRSGYRTHPVVSHLGTILVPISHFIPIECHLLVAIGLVIAGFVIAIGLPLLVIAATIWWP
ncbi:hypothetical protein [Nocardia sp. NBC_01329]|uniref:hypothetical protein n=1 Tax=Nocardia sp. NBC_01329 TaxID=2903594 RepID=UPI002E130FB2|nr:hypothetical protein OG405_03245 [Nocardia sp. NBC_01329]